MRIYKNLRKQWILVGVCLVNGVSFGATRARFTGETILNDPTVRISAGSAHTCQARADGFVRCWGANDHQQSGSPLGGINVAIPQGLGGLPPGLAIASGLAHTCMLNSSG